MRLVARGGHQKTEQCDDDDPDPRLSLTLFLEREPSSSIHAEHDLGRFHEHGNARATLSPSSSAASLVIDEVIDWPPSSATLTIVITLPGVIECDLARQLIADRETHRKPPVTKRHCAHGYAGCNACTISVVALLCSSSGCALTYFTMNATCCADERLRGDAEAHAVHRILDAADVGDESGAAEFVVAARRLGALHLRSTTPAGARTRRPSSRGPSSRSGDLRRMRRTSSCVALFVSEYPGPRQVIARRYREGAQIRIADQGARIATRRSSQRPCRPARPGRPHPCARCSRARETNDRRPRRSRARRSIRAARRPAAAAQDRRDRRACPAGTASECARRRDARHARPTACRPDAAESRGTRDRARRQRRRRLRLRRHATAERFSAGDERDTRQRARRLGDRGTHGRVRDRGHVGPSRALLHVRKLVAQCCDAARRERFGDRAP